MKRNKVLLSMLLAFVLLIGGAYVLYDRLGQGSAAQQMIVHSGDPAPEATEKATSGAQPETIPAPDFTVYDENGQAVKLSRYFGKPIVLNFWASWCGPCQSEMPDFNEKYLELGDEIHFVMVNMTTGRETVESATAFIRENGYAFPVLYDTGTEAAMAYGAYSLPTSFFINAQGHVVAQAVGAINAETLQRGIDMITE